MQDAEKLKRRIEGTEDLQSVVRTMKTLSAASIRQYERAAYAIRAYYRTVETGLAFALQRKTPVPRGGDRYPAQVTALVFGSDQGMCGQFNRAIAELASGELNGDVRQPPEVIAIGHRVVPFLKEKGVEISRAFQLPGSLEGVKGLIYQLLSCVEPLEPDDPSRRLLLYYNSRRTGQLFHSARKKVAPIDTSLLTQTLIKGGTRRGLAFYRLPHATLWRGLLRQHLFVSVYQACLESLQSEHATRMATMQAAEKNIEEKLSELQKLYSQLRQEGITSELLEIVSGYEALRKRE